jgi:hypothetical protein
VDFYSSCLLMPRGLVFDPWQSKFGTSSPFIFSLHKNDAIARLHYSNWVPLSAATARAFGVAEEPPHMIAFNRISRDFATTFGVSTEAVRIRLVKLGLLLEQVPRQHAFAI